MKRLLCLCLSALSCSAGFSQVRFSSVFETGISLPVGEKAGIHNANGISIGNHIDLNFGSGAFSWGVGGYIGHINTNGVNDKYKETGMLIARRYQLQPSQLVFNSTSFQSTQFLLGPVAGFNCHNFNMRLWAKGGFGIADPARYSVLYREGSTEQKIYVSDASDNKNGLSYDLGAGFYYLMTNNLGVQLSASYNNTKTNQINYNYEQEKGTMPSYTTANNAFIKASIGLVVNLGSNRRDTRTYTGGRKNAREAGSGMATGRRDTRTYNGGRKNGREAGSGMATGRRQYQPIVIHIEDADNAEQITTRDAATGLPTGRRMHKPVVVRIDNGYDEPFEVVVNNGGSTGPVIVVASAQAVAGNPLYSQSGNSGENPLFEGKGIAPSGKGITQSGISSEKGIQENGIKRVEDKGINEAGIPAGKGINQAGLSSEKGITQSGLSSEKGIQEKGIRRTEDKGINQSGVQRTVNTSRANIKSLESINCQGNDCDTKLVLEIDGEEITLLIKRTYKTRRRVEVLKSN